MNAQESPIPNQNKMKTKLKIIKPTAENLFLLITLLEHQMKLDIGTSLHLYAFDDITDLDKSTAENPFLSINLLEHLMKLNVGTRLHGMYLIPSLIWRF